MKGLVYLLILINYISAVTVIVHHDSKIKEQDNNIKGQKSYKMSMVASDSDSSRPALFLHGEGPVWRANSLYFVDVHAQNVHRLDYRTGNIDTKHIEYGQVNVVCPVLGSKLLLVAVRSSLYLLDFDKPGDNALRLLTTVDLGLPDNVINEGKADAMGRFWFGTKGPQKGDAVAPDKATFYSVEQSALPAVSVQLKPVSISNGLVWSLNNTVLYYIDSPTQKVEAFNFDVKLGEISGRRTIIDLKDYGYTDGIPDGMTIDSNGYLWVAVMFGGSVLHVDPEEKTIIQTYELPVSRVTSVAWGGPHLDELFITTGQDPSDESKEPFAGAIFTLRDTGSRGVPFNFVRYSNADLY